MKPRITALTLGVDDLERSLAFYRDGLGLESQGIVGQEFEYGAVAFAAKFWAGLAPAALLGPTQRAVLAGPGQWQLRLLHRSILRASYAPLGFIHVALQQHEREPATAVVVSRVDQRVGGLD
jgi:catechol 2,3-dioxygenase-like lactoylglutathione lyase family enzyme